MNQVSDFKRSCKTIFRTATVITTVYAAIFLIIILLEAVRQWPVTGMALEDFVNLVSVLLFFLGMYFALTGKYGIGGMIIVAVSIWFGIEYISFAGYKFGGYFFIPLFIAGALYLLCWRNRRKGYIVYEE